MTAWFPGPGWLFCPADRPDRYLKALAVAEVVILDLEDAVASEGRGGARQELRRLVLDGHFDRERTVVRVNGSGRGTEADHEADLTFAEAIGLPRVMLAKAEDPASVSAIKHEVIALLETPRGVEYALDVAGQDNVIGVMWGADDLVAGLGGTSSRYPDGRLRDVPRYARSRALLAAKTHGRLALDAVHMDIPDLDGLSVECEDAAATGFDGTVAIHPSQLTTIRAAYTPTVELVSWARRLLDHIGDDRGVATFEGRMVDGPVYTQAERILRLASMAKGSR
ncbi:HpcH/HpaI aldolase/citrate lyase family protein [Pedococcus sp. P5_B7]